MMLIKSCMSYKFLLGHSLKKKKSSKNQLLSLKGMKKKIKFLFDTIETSPWKLQMKRYRNYSILQLFSIWTLSRVYETLFNILFSIVHLHPKITVRVSLMIKVVTFWIRVKIVRYWYVSWWISLVAIVIIRMGMHLLQLG